MCALINDRILLALLVLTVFAGGCNQDPSAEKAKYMSDMVTAFNKNKKEFLKQTKDPSGKTKDVFEDLRAYKDGKEDVVVVERKLSRDYPPTKMDLKTVLLKEAESNEEIKKALQMGIAIRFIDKTADGETVNDATITKEDL